MMHNSLLIRERLLEMNQSELHKSRRDPHRFIHPLDASMDAGEDEVKLDGSWSVIGDESNPVIRETVRDLNDFLLKFGLPVVTEPSVNCIRFILDTGHAEGNFKRTVNPTGIEIAASDSKGLWAGLIDLERALCLKRAPIVPHGTVEREPRWKVQMSQSPFGSNYLVPDLSEPYLSDDAFRMLVHFGINGMTIYGDWLLYVNSSIFPELNCKEYQHHIEVLKDACERAGNFGVSLYFVPVSPKLLADHPLFERVPAARGAKINPGISPRPKGIHNLCSTDPDVLAFHGETMANLFREVPLLGGLNLIIGGESYYHCYMRPDKSGLPQGQQTNCPRCSAYSPEEVVAGLLKATADAVHGIKPEAPVMAWPYSAFVWSSDPAQLQLLERMDEKVALLSTIDKDQWAQKDGYKKLIWDYSIDYTGPADNLLKQADILKERQMQLYVKTETSLGLEFIQFPYIPCLQRIARKWDHVGAMKPIGVLQSWMFYGMWGSRTEELGWWASWHPEISLLEVVSKIAQRDFGALAPDLVKAWEHTSEAMGHLPYIPAYFTGPEFIGPAHPLYFSESLQGWEHFEALLYYLQENEETFSTTVNEVKHSLVMGQVPYQRIQSVMKADPEHGDYWTLFMDEYGKALSHVKQAWEMIKNLEAPADPITSAVLHEEKLLCELIYRTFVTIYNTYSFLHLKETYRQRGDVEQLRHMIQIASGELENAKQARSLYEQAPWFDLSLRVDGKYPSSLAMIDQKISLMEEQLGRLEQSI